MNSRILSLLWLLFTCVCGCPASAVDTSAFSWPDGRRAAVSLAYDDALDSQLDVAIPALDRHGLKGSFYLQLSGDTLRTRLGDWRAAAAHGHELGNHTLFHQCSGSARGHEWVQPARDLNHTTALQMRDQVLLANLMLAAIDGQKERSFTVPCGDTLAQGENYVERVKSEFVGIKLGEGGIPEDMRTFDRQAVTVMIPVGATGTELISALESAADQGTMVNFTFHGIGGDYLSVSAAAHEELLDHLAAHPDVYWVDTFLNLMRHVRLQERGAATDGH